MCGTISPLRSAAQIAVIMALVAGCVEVPPERATRAPKQDVTFVPDAQGIAVAPLGLRLDFGRAPKGVVAPLDRDLGPHKVLAVTGCPSGKEQIAAQYAWGALVLTFTTERFVGWRKGAKSQGVTCAP